MNRIKVRIKQEIFRGIKICIINYRKTFGLLRQKFDTQNLKIHLRISFIHLVLAELRQSQHNFPTLILSNPFFSSLHRDEDNDIAHEFYEEVKYKDGRSRMKKVFNTLPLVSTLQ